MSINHDENADESVVLWTQNWATDLYARTCAASDSDVDLALQYLLPSGLYLNDPAKWKAVASMDAPKKLDWSNDQIARFWDYASAQETSQQTYFAFQVGEAVARVAEHVRPLAGLDVLDFGSGPGHLIPRLLSRGAQVSAADYSPNSVKEVSKRFSKHSNWDSANIFDGKRLPWDDDSFDVVFCLETIEHLHADDCAHIFDELLRVLRPGGFALYTTPNEEDLSQHNVYCPGCNCEFHRMQHMRSWSSTELTEQLVKHAYDVTFCKGLNLHDFQRPSRWRFSTMRRYLKNLSLQVLDQVFPRPFPTHRLLNQAVKPRHRRNLVAVAMKPKAGAHVTPARAA